MRLRATLALATSLFLGGCGSSLTVSQLQSQIDHDLNLQVMGRASLGTLPNTGNTTASASVTCPKNAKLKKGSVFYCSAGITSVTTPPPGSTDFTPKVNTETRQVKVTMTSDSRANWELQ